MKEAGDFIQPASVRGDFDGFQPLNIPDEIRAELIELNKLAKSTDHEYGFAVYTGGKTDIQTDNSHNSILIGAPANSTNIEIYHSHTDDSVLSTRDICSSALRVNVSRESVISINGDVWIIDYVGGIRPDETELSNALKMCDSDAKAALQNDPLFDSWSVEEKGYMLGREKMLRMARLFEWNLMGGNIND